MLTELSHQELSLLIFILEGAGAVPEMPSDTHPSCEEACPVVEHFEALFEDGAIPREKKLLNHLGNHLREGLIECGMFDLMARTRPGVEHAPSAEDREKLQQVN